MVHEPPTLDPLTRRLLLLALLVFMGVASLASRQAEQARQAVPARHVAELQPGDALSDIGPDAGVDGRKVKPRESWQKGPPCGKKEREILGACYRRAHPDDFRPPCDAPTVEWTPPGGAPSCWYAVAADRKPSSIER